MLKKSAKVALIWINRVLQHLGARVVRANAVPRGFTGFFDHVKKLGIQPSLIVDVGVADGTMEIYNAFPNSKYLLVEPNADFKPALERICSKLDGDYLIAAASDHEGVLDFNVHADPLGSSLLGEVEGELADGQKRSVKTVRLDEVIPEDVGGGIMLKVDVQGAELQVVDGASNRLNDIEIIILEVSLISSMDGGPEVWHVVDHMNSLGFVVYDIVGGGVRPLDGALKQIDLVFVSRDSPLRQDRRYATEGQRRKLNERANARWKRSRQRAVAAARVAN